MNAFRRGLDVPDMRDLREGAPPSGAGGADPPIGPPRDDGGGPRRGAGGPQPLLSLLFVGAALVTVERLMMLVFMTQGLPVLAYAAAGGVLCVVVFTGVFAGGYLFWRGWHEDRR